MIPYVAADIISPVDFYSEEELSDVDISYLLTLVNDGYDKDAEDIFVDEFMIPAALRYQNAMANYMNVSNSGPMRIADQDKLSRSVTLLTIGLIGLLSNNFSKYVKELHTKNIFEKAEIVDSSVKKSITSEVINEFEQLISGSMASTQGFVLNSIRTLQREMVAENLLFKNSGITGEVLEAEIIRFKNSLQIKYPQIYKAMQSGNILTTNKFVEGVAVTRHYKLDYYIDLSVRTTLLNVDRTSNIISALTNDEDIVEYYLADNRSVKKDREICQHILQTKYNGMSILALTDEAAKRYGVMTVDEAKSTPDFALGPYCRHSMRRCSAAYLKEVENGN